MSQPYVYSKSVHTFIVPYTMKRRTESKYRRKKTLQMRPEATTKTPYTSFAQTCLKGIDHPS